MSKIKHVYVTGDSFSFGQELGGSDVPVEDFYVFTPYMRQTSYTGIISDAWGVDGYTNTSYNGGSNDRIHRMIINDIPRLLTEYKPEEIFIFISLTHASRREFYQDYANEYSPFLSNHEPPKGNVPNHTLWKIYATYFDSAHEHARRYMLQVLSMQAFLKTLGVGYLMTRSMHDGAKFDQAFDNLPQCQHNLIDRITFPKMQAFNGFATLKRVPFGKYQHPLEDGHAAWANHLLEYMKNNNLGQL
jgi:hypothetical protein